jgi:hypothetical protein
VLNEEPGEESSRRIDGEEREEDSEKRMGRTEDIGVANDEMLGSKKCRCECSRTHRVPLMYAMKTDLKHRKLVRCLMGNRPFPLQSTPQTPFQKPSPRI